MNKNLPLIPYPNEVKIFENKSGKNTVYRKMVDTLIAHGADINAVDNAGKKVSDIVEMLKEYIYSICATYLDETIHN